MNTPTDKNQLHESIQARKRPNPTPNSDNKTPLTPQQRRAQVWASPSYSYRSEDESLVFEFGARSFRAGFAGESSPRCTLRNGPEEARRVDDYTRWLPGYEKEPKRRRRGLDWGEDHELWQMDLRQVDLGLVEDKIERIVRGAFSKYLQISNRARRMIAVLPPVMPLPLLDRLLTALFQNFQNPTITLLSTPVLNVVAAGCRSGLVVDIGWSETLVNSIYEYREVHSRRSVRAMKYVSFEMAKILRQYDGQAPTKASQQGIEENSHDTSYIQYFEKSEEATTRIAWCRSYQEAHTSAKDISQQLDSLSLHQNPESTPNLSPSSQSPTITLPSPSSPHRNIQIPFSEFALPAETILFPLISHSDLDSHNQPLPQLVYESLLSLPPDIRATCMSRIIITGGGSNIPGLKCRLLDEVSALVQQRGWNAVQGKAADKHRRRLEEISTNLQRPEPQIRKTSDSNTQPPHTQSQLSDPILDKIHQDDRRGTKSTISGVIRGVETLGAWAGASLLGSLKIKGMTEIDRDEYALHGIAGAKKVGEMSGVDRAISGKVEWTLGGWA